MSDVVIGTLDSIDPRDTSYGKMWNITVNGVTYGNGKMEPKIQLGKCVKFRPIKKGSFINVAPGSLEEHVLEPGETMPELPAQVRNHVQANDDRQNSIILQSARNAAIETVAILVSANACGIKATSKWAESHDLIMAKINDLTREYYWNAQQLGKFVGNPPVEV